MMKNVHQRHCQSTSSNCKHAAALFFAISPFHHQSNDCALHLSREEFLSTLISAYLYTCIYKQRVHKMASSYKSCRFPQKGVLFISAQHSPMFGFLRTFFSPLIYNVFIAAVKVFQSLSSNRGRTGVYRRARWGRFHPLRVNASIACRE